MTYERSLLINIKLITFKNKHCMQGVADEDDF